MSNKTILQNNNTNLASYTDRVTALINTVNNLPDAGSGGSGGGSGGGSVEIGTFTCEGLFHRLLDDQPTTGQDDTENYIIPFVIGMTWGEFVESELNTPLFLEGFGFSKFYIDNGQIAHYMASGSLSTISTDGTYSGCVSVTDLIQPNTHYNTYFDNNSGDFPV